MDSGFSQQEQALEQEAQADEDNLLRELGHPLSSIYAFRAASVTYDTIRQLPVPWYDHEGHIPESYWNLLQEYGLPSSALPRYASGHSSHPSFTAREQELRSFAAQASRAFS